MDHMSVNRLVACDRNSYISPYNSVRSLFQSTSNEWVNGTDIYRGSYL